MIVRIRILLCLILSYFYQRYECNHYFISLTQHQNALEVYETKTGKKRQEIFFTRKNKPDPDEIGYDIDEGNSFQCVSASVTAGYIASCVNSTKYVNGKYEQCCWLVCHDLNTFEILSSAECYFYMKMSTSKVGWLILFCIGL